MPTLSLTDIVYNRASHIGDVEALKTKHGLLLTQNIINVSCNNICESEGSEICELIYNALDSYDTKNKIGKFGFGFYSIIGTIYGKPEKSIVIDTTYSDITCNVVSLRRYKAVIKDRSYGDIIVEYEELPLDSLITGTSITITDGRCCLIHDKILNAVRFYTETNIMCEIKSEILGEDEFCNFEIYDSYGDPIYLNEIYQMNRSDEQYPIISNNNKFSIALEFDLDTKTIKITDFGTGIHPDILFNTMLIPSISSKKIVHNMSSVEYANQTTILRCPDCFDMFCIIVGGVTVFHSTAGYFGMNCPQYVLSMPSWTPVSLVRDDIIIDSSELSEILAINLRKLIEDTINYNANLIPLWHYLELYISRTKVKENKRVIIQVMNDTRSRDDLFFISSDCKLFKIFNEIFAKHNRELRLVQFPDCNLYKLEEYILENMTTLDCWKYSKQIYWNKHVFIVSGLQCNVTCAGFSSLLFVSKEYTESYPNWIVDISLSYNGDRLYPSLAPTILQDKQKFLKSIIHHSLKNFYNELCSVYIAMLGVLPSFGNTTQHINEIAILIFEEVRKLNMGMSDESIKIYIRSLYILFSQAKAKGHKFIVTMPVAVSRYTDELNAIDEDLDILLWLNDLCVKNGSCYCSTRYLLRKSYIKAGPVNHIFCQFFDKNKITPREELIMREVLKRCQLPTFKDYIKPLTYLLRELRFRYTDYIMEDCFDKYMFTDMSKVEITIYKPLLLSLSMYVSTLSLKSHKLCPLLEYCRDFTFSGKQLFNMLFCDPETSLANGNEIELKVQNSCGYPNHTDFQIFDAVINTGTTKDYISAVLTELTQNSIDAMRCPNSTDRILSTGFCNDSQPAIYFQDFVGIDEINIVYLLVPFLSSKLASKNNSTGFMGTGLFNIYRQPYCNKVLIQTVTPKNIINIECVPILDHDKVIDVLYNYQCRDNNTKEKSGTTFVIYIQGEKKIINSLFVDMALFVNNSMINIDCQVVFNQVPLKQNKLLIYENQEAKLFHCPTSQSYIFTNGIPLKAVEGHNTQLITCGFVLDVKPGYYEARQSRNNAIGLENITHKYFNFFKVWCIVNDYFPMKVQKELLPFIDCKGEYDQYQMDRYYHADYYFLSEDGASDGIIFNINKIIIALNGRIPTWFLIKSLSHHTCHPVYVSCIWKWFQNKATPLKRNIECIENKLISDKTHYIQKFTDIYWSIGRKLEKTGYLRGTIFDSREDAPHVIIGAVNAANGCYIPSTHEIYLDSKSFNISEYNKEINLLLKILDKNERLIALREFPTLFKLFGITSPLNTLLHELTHSHRPNTSTPHDKISLTINEKTGCYSFDDGGAVIASIISEYGLYSEFLS